MIIYTITVMYDEGIFYRRLPLESRMTPVYSDQSLINDKVLE